MDRPPSYRPVPRLQNQFGGRANGTVSRKVFGNVCNAKTAANGRLAYSRGLILGGI